MYYNISVERNTKIHIHVLRYVLVYVNSVTWIL